MSSSASVKKVLSFFQTHPEDINNAVVTAEQTFGQGNGQQKAEAAVGMIAATATAIDPAYAGYAYLFQLLGGVIINGVVAHKNATKTMPVVTSPAVQPDPPASAAPTLVPAPAPTKTS